MITAEQKPIQEIIQYIAPYGRILLVGCNECVTVCAAGGRKEVGLLASALHLNSLKQGKTIDIKAITLERQCDPEYVEELAPYIDGADAVLSMAYGCGVQTVAGRYKTSPVFPAVNTRFMEAPLGQGVWAERCKGCGDCVLGITGDICPVGRCSKHLFNGPCDGTSNGQCEISPDVDCAWRLIWERLKTLGMEDRYEDLMNAKDWRPGGAAKIIREDLAQ